MKTIMKYELDGVGDIGYQILDIRYHISDIRYENMNWMV